MTPFAFHSLQPEGDSPSVANLWRMSIPEGVTHIVAFALSTSSVFGAIRASKETARKLVLVNHRALSDKEADIFAAHAVSADVVVSVGDGAAAPLTVRFFKRNYAKVPLSSVHRKMSPFLLAGLPEQQGVMPMYNNSPLFITIICERLTDASLKAAAAVHHYRKGMINKLDVWLLIVGVADAAAKVQAHVDDPDFPVLSFMCASMGDAMPVLGGSAMVLVPDAAEEPFCHAAEFALSMGVPVLVPRGTPIASLLEKSKIGGMTYNPLEKGAVGVRLTYLFANDNNFKTAWANATAFSKQHRKDHGALINSFLGAL